MCADGPGKGWSISPSEAAVRDRENTQGAVLPGTADGQHDPLAGTPYRFLRRLSESGAMGEVVEAEQRALRKRVAVKLIRHEFAKDSGFVDRMRLEAEALGAIAPHPHVVTVLDLGLTPDGRAYLVMEKLVGRTLKEELAARGFIPVGEAVALARQLLDGLAAAHRVGVVHRDIKPDNLFLCDPVHGQRTLKILDFGIAKVVHEHTEGPAPLALPTRQGVMVGTPRFLSPEQACGLPVDHRADIYSAGAVLYALLTGRDPFNHHRALFNVLRAHVNEAPHPPSSGAPQAIPEAVERVVMKALEKRPEDRWASAVELSTELDHALRCPPQAWTTTQPIDVRAFASRGLRQVPALEEPEEAATLQLPVAGALGLPRTHALGGPPAAVASRRPVAWMAAALFAAVACIALSAWLVHAILSVR
jgi:serine/threonine-protein kinase